MLDDARKADLSALNSQLKVASPENRKKIEKTMHNIVSETRLQRSMRKELIKASRNNDVKAMKEIREYVAEKKKYQNG